MYIYTRIYQRTGNKMVGAQLLAKGLANLTVINGCCDKESISLKVLGSAFLALCVLCLLQTTVRMAVFAMVVTSSPSHLDQSIRFFCWSDSLLTSSPLC